MHRVAEPLLFGAGSLVVIGIVYLIHVAGWTIDASEGPLWRTSALLADLVQVAGIGALAFIAGRRRSAVDLLAIVAFNLAGPVASAVV